MMVSKNEHITELLPAYLNDTLNSSSRDIVRTHLRHCAACRNELVSWQSVADTTIQACKKLPGAPTGSLESALATIRAGEDSASPATRFRLAWQLLAEQRSLVRKEIWIASALTMAVGCLVAVLVSTGISAAGVTFTVFAPIVAAAGVAFVYGADNDPSLEIALATPTSPRSILLARLVLVYSYDLTLAVIATFVLAGSKGSFDIWPLITLWVGPMLFLSALALLVSVLFSSAAALSVALVLWGAYLALGTRAGTAQLRPEWVEFLQNFWYATNILLIPLAFVLFIVALLCAPLTMRPTHERAT